MATTGSIFYLPHERIFHNHSQILLLLSIAKESNSTAVALFHKEKSEKKRVSFCYSNNDSNGTVIVDDIVDRNRHFDANTTSALYF